MGDAKNRDRKLGRSYLDRLAAAREREIENSNRLARELEAYAAEVQAQAKRIGMALGTTQIMAEIPALGAKDADGVPVPTGKKETHPARVVLIGLDALLERLAMMERAVDGACPSGGKDPACECVACKVRTASGMLFRTAPVEEMATDEETTPAEPPAPGRVFVKDAEMGPTRPGQGGHFVDAPANVPSASAVEAGPEIIHGRRDPADAEKWGDSPAVTGRFSGGTLEIGDEIPEDLAARPVTALPLIGDPCATCDRDSNMCETCARLGEVPR